MDPCWFCAIFAAFISCHVHSGFGLHVVPLPRPADVPVGTATEYYAVFGHHKTGTDLLTAIMQDMVTALGSNYTYSEYTVPMTMFHKFNVDYPLWGHPFECIPSQVTLVQLMDVPLLKTILQKCPDVRALHLVRQPSEMVVSNYAYETALDPHSDDDNPMARKVGPLMSHMSLATGVEFYCEYTNRLYIQDMVDVHRYIRQNQLDNILEVRLEDFSRNYDATTRSIFEHYLGKNHALIDSLVEHAVEHDVNRMSSSELQGNDHLSSVDLKAEARLEMRRQGKAGSPCVKKLLEEDQVMGFDDASW